MRTDPGQRTASSLLSHSRLSRRQSRRWRHLRRYRRVAVAASPNQVETRTVSEAIAKLIDEGLIQETKGSDSRVVYRVHPDAHNVQNIQERLSEIRSSLDN